MPLVYSTVACSEIYDSRKWSGDVVSGWTASVQLQVNKANLYDLILDLLVNQRECPFIPDNPPTVKSASVSTITTNNNAPIDQGFDYEEYFVDVSYSNTIRTIVSEEIEPVAEFIRLDPRRFRWTSGAPLTEGEAPGYLYQTMNLIFKYVNQPAIPPAFLSGIGKVHNAVWLSPTTGLSYAAETLMFCPAPISNTYTTGGSSGFNYTIKFAYRPNGWNKYWRPQTQAWESIYLDDGTLYKSYPPADLSSLLP